MSFVAVGSTTSLGALSGTMAGVAGGAAIGAGIGQLAGGDTESTLMGAGLGAGGGFAAGGGLGALGGASSSAPLGTAANPAFSAGMAVPGGGSTSGGIFGGLTSGLIPGQEWSSPLMLGTAGMNLMSASSSQGQSPQQKVDLSQEGKRLKKTWTSAIKQDLAKAKKGDVSDRAFADVSNLKSKEGNRSRASQAAISSANAVFSNTGYDSRGTPASGGNSVRTLMQEAGERMEGKFAPTSVLNSYSREALLNAVGQVQNVSNLDNQVASFNYQGRLAKWNANNMAAANKGAAIGSIASMMGGVQNEYAYNNQVKNIMSS